MQGRKTAMIVQMDDATRQELLAWLRAQKTPVGLAKRAWAMLLLAEGHSYAATTRQVGLRERHIRKWAKRFLRDGPAGLHDAPAPAARRSFPPEVAVHLVKIACEMPDRLGVSLSHWDCVELGRKLVADGVVKSISPQTVGRILNHHRLKPWRHHLWLSPNVPRDAAFAASVQHIVDLYTRPLGAREVVLCVDEKTSLQPRTRRSPTLPARLALPVRVEHEYQRKGALNLFAAFDTRSGKVYGYTAERKRQKEFIEFLETVASLVRFFGLARADWPMISPDAERREKRSWTDQVSTLRIVQKVSHEWGIFRHRGSSSGVGITGEDVALFAAGEPGVMVWPGGSCTTWAMRAATGPWTST